MATVRSSRVSRGRYTSPIPPAPSGATISYGAEARASGESHRSWRPREPSRPSDSPRETGRSSWTPFEPCRSRPEAITRNPERSLAPRERRRSGNSRPEARPGVRSARWPKLLDVALNCQRHGQTPRQLSASSAVRGVPGVPGVSDREAAEVLAGPIRS
jgi:hypothetical protein